MSTTLPRPLGAPLDFDELFEAHARFVWRVLRRHGVPERELPDGCQEVFLVVHRRLSEFEGRSSVRTWIYAIARHVAQGIRRRPDLAHVDLDTAAFEPACPASQLASLEQKQRLERIEAALAALSEDKREVFALYELENMTMAEVATALRIPENTALSRLYVAREQIRSTIARLERPDRARLRSGGKGAR